jgi:hypothetical protein
MPRYEKESPLETLRPAHSRSVLTVDLNHLFKIEKSKGWYKVRISYEGNESKAGHGGPVEMEIILSSRK